MTIEMEKNFFNELESKTIDKENKEFLFFHNDKFVTYKFKIDKYKLNKFINKLDGKYGSLIVKEYPNISISEYEVKNPVTNTGNVTISYDNIQKYVEVIKTSLFHKKEDITYTASKKVSTYEEPYFIKVVRNIENRKYLNLVDLYNYILTHKGLDKSNMQSSYGANPKIRNMGYVDLSIKLNEKEKNLTDEDVDNMIKELFRCFIVIEEKVIDTTNETIDVDLNSSYDDLINLRSKLNIAKKNTELFNDDLATLNINKDKKVKVR